MVTPRCTISPTSALWPQLQDQYNCLENDVTNSLYSSDLPSLNQSFRLTDLESTTIDFELPKWALGRYNGLAYFSNRIPLGTINTDGDTKLSADEIRNYYRDHTDAVPSFAPTVARMHVLSERLPSLANFQGLTRQDLKTAITRGKVLYAELAKIMTPEQIAGYKVYGLMPVTLFTGEPLTKIETKFGMKIDRNFATDDQIDFNATAVALNELMALIELSQAPVKTEADAHITLEWQRTSAPLTAQEVTYLFQVCQDVVAQNKTIPLGNGTKLVSTNTKERLQAQYENAIAALPEFCVEPQLSQVRTALQNSYATAMAKTYVDDIGSVTAQELMQKATTGQFTPQELTLLHPWIDAQAKKLDLKPDSDLDMNYTNKKLAKVGTFVTDLAIQLTPSLATFVIMDRLLDSKITKPLLENAFIQRMAVKCPGASNDAQTRKSTYDAYLKFAKEHAKANPKLQRILWGLGKFIGVGVVGIDYSIASPFNNQTEYGSYLDRKYLGDSPVLQETLGMRIFGFQPLEWIYQVVLAGATTLVFEHFADGSLMDEYFKTLPQQCRQYEAPGTQPAPETVPATPPIAEHVWHNIADHPLEYLKLGAWGAMTLAAGTATLYGAGVTAGGGTLTGLGTGVTGGLVASGVGAGGGLITGAGTVVAGDATLVAGAATLVAGTITAASGYMFLQQLQLMQALGAI